MPSERRSVIHTCPPPGEFITPCCGQAPFDLPHTDRMTTDPSLVDCAPRSETVADVRLDMLPDPANKDRWASLTNDELRAERFNTKIDTMAALGAASMMEVAAEIIRLGSLAEEHAQRFGLGGELLRCMSGEMMVWLPYDRALVPGHIYSQDGAKEARISGTCEFHFDRMLDEEWVDAITGEPGLMNPDREKWVQGQKEAEVLEVIADSTWDREDSSDG